MQHFLSETIDVVGFEKYALNPSLYDFFVCINTRDQKNVGFLPLRFFGKKTFDPIFE